MKKNLLALLAIFCVSTAVGAFSGCFSAPIKPDTDSSTGGSDSSISSSSSEDVESPAFLTEWATTTTGKCDYFESYTVETGSVTLPNGTECYPTVEVKNSKNETVVLVGNIFDVEYMDGYTVTWTIEYDGEIYVKTLNLSVNVPNPTVLFGTVDECYKGIVAVLPKITVLDADGSRIEDFTYTLTDPNGEIVATENGKFRPETIGMYIIEVTTKGMNEQEVKQSTTLEVKDIPAGMDITLAHYDTNTDWFSAEGKEFATSIYGMKAIDSTTTEEFKVKVDVGMSLEDLKEKFDYIEFDIYYWGENGAHAYVRSSAGGANLITRHIDQGETEQLDYWQDQFLTLPVADFDGYLYFQCRWTDNPHFQITMRSAVAKVERKIDIDEHAQKVLIGETFTIPAAKYLVHGVEQEDTVSITATFNGEPVADLGASVSFNEIGTLVLTYSVGELKKEITVEYVNAKKIVVADHADSVFIGTKYLAPAAHVINDITGETLADETVTITAKFNGASVELGEGYEIKALGTMELTYALDGLQPVVVSVNVTTSETYMNTVATSETYMDSAVMSKITSDAEIKDIAFPGWAQFGVVDGKTAKAIHFNHPTDGVAQIYTVTFDSEFVEEVKANYSNLTLTMSLWTNGWKVTVTVNGAAKEMNGNAVVTLAFATADWDGTIKLQATNPTWDYTDPTIANGYNLCITKVEGSVDSSLTLDEYVDEVLIGATVDLVGATYKIGKYVQDASLIQISATFDGEPIDMTNGYVTTEIGTIEIKYTAGDFEKTATIRVLPNQGIVVSEYDKAVFIDTVVTVPTAQVVDNESHDVLDKEITVTATFNDVAVTLGTTFTSAEAGTLVITYSSADLKDVVVRITFSATLILREQDAMSLVTSDAEIKDVAFPGWAQFGVVDGKTASAIHFNDIAEHTVTFDSEFVASVKAGKSARLTLTISLYDNGWNIHATVNGKKTQLGGNGVVTLTFATADWDGTIKLQAFHTDWAHPSDVGYNLHISKIEGTYVANVRDQDVMSLVSSETATIKDVAFPGWGQFGVVDGQTATAIYFKDINEHTVTFNSEFVDSVKAAKYSKLSLTISLWDNGWHVNATANGTTKELCGNAVVTFEFETANWDGTIKLQAFHTDWYHNPDDESANSYSLHISKIEGIYA